MMATRQFRSRSGIHQKSRVFVILQKAGRNQISHFALDRLAHDLSFVLTPGDQHESLRIQNRAHSHRDSGTRNIRHAHEIGRRILPRHAVQRNHPRFRIFRRTRFVESNVTRSTNTQNL